jgi:hypothetical protein
MPGSRSGRWPEDLTRRQKAKLALIEKTNQPLYRAYLLKEQIRQVFHLRQPWRALRLLDHWLAWARRFRLPSFVSMVLAPMSPARCWSRPATNPERMRSESAFAHLCGVAPLPASSGKTTGRHRLNRGGDRQANNALWHTVMVRLSCHQPTRDYMARRTTEGLSKKEIIRCLKRYVAREVYRAFVSRRELAPAA